MDAKYYFVGESNPWGSDPHFALYPAPNGSAGHRLCRAILGIARATYLEVFTRVNLCDGGWSTRAARRRASEMRAESAERDRLVLLGARVAAAFDLPFRPFETFGEDALVLPHPSGRCRIWNDPDSIARARIALRQFLPPEVGGLIAEPWEGVET
jgi:hypothetical protein